MSGSSGPCVFVSVPHGASAGNVLRTGMVRRLLDAPSRPRIVLLSPLVHDPAFAKEFHDPRIALEDLPAHRPAGLEARLFALIQASYIDSGVTESVKIRRLEAVAKKTIRWIRAKRLLASAIAPSIVRPSTRYDLVDRFVSHPRAEALFERHRPSLVVVSSPGLIFSEVPLLRTAVRRRIPSMAVDPSWDNFTNKLIPVRRVGRLVVWNDIMRDQAIALHGYEPPQVTVAGAPQFDIYFRDRQRTSHDAFFARIGADPARKLITVSTTPRELYSHHDHVLRVLSRAIETEAFGVPAQVLVRLHPRDSRDAYREFEGAPHVIVEKPFRETVRVADGLAVDVMPEHQAHLADTLEHSDVIVNVASTIALEACIFDTPVVNIAFDGETPSDYVRSARRYYSFTHYANITGRHAVRVAWQPGEMVDAIRAYLHDPALDAEGRRLVAKDQCQFVDGRSAERVAASVVDELEAVHAGAEGRRVRCA